MGDFNLDWSKKDLDSYKFKNYFTDMELATGDLNLMQLVNFPTWSRVVNNIIRESTIDHIYASNPTSVHALGSISPFFGDHLMVYVECAKPKINNNTSYRRNWLKYDKNLLNSMLLEVDWDFQDDTVQGFWNSFENGILGVIDLLVPMTKESSSANKINVPQVIKRKINRRKNLLKKLKINNNLENKKEIRVLNQDIKNYFSKKRTEKIRKIIVPGNSKSIWKAVKVAKDVNTTTLPTTMFEKNVEIPENLLPDRFAGFFDIKIKNLLEEVEVDDSVYNGRKQIATRDKFFMDLETVREIMGNLKNKNSEGYDRIPQKILHDGANILSVPMQKLMQLIYKEKKVPDQWLVAKTFPVFKNKGNKKDIENYRPIANLCSSSKVFEKLILKRILDIQEEAKIDLTGVNQHGFKKNKSTSTLSVELLSMIARAIDNDECVMVCSIDLSSAFDLVNIDLLLKRLKIIGLPNDLIALISAWLRHRLFYVCINGENSTYYELLLGTVQGSILGPILYALFISPLFDIEDLFSFADDNFIPKSNSSMLNLVNEAETTLETITEWMRHSGLKVNESKTEACLFSKRDCAPLVLNIGHDSITTKKTLNVLGVIFDSKLQWTEHVAMAISKSNRALNALRMISKHFNMKELINLTTSNYYSILMYNSEVWQSSALKENLKHSLFVASAKALRLCNHYRDAFLSYYDLHKLTTRATPAMFSNYKCALLLYKTFNALTWSNEWLFLNFSIINTSRQNNFMINRSNSSRCGLNATCNKFVSLNGMIPLTWLNLEFSSYKIKCKKLFLSFNS